MRFIISPKINKVESYCYGCGSQCQNNCGSQCNSNTGGKL
jgi:Cys-rich peptide (Clo7bot family)